ncbi:hypothetical protein K461DRAFT_257495 [Myriangium duriaei CBS 260.36]|uniref:Thioredoxin-like fold domain-containing protein n=1 Tax=Myriangium duriaei CBS 260.36 TaxID=1168546 RepID=A0A9P4J426_9PEZI|nr:hypothetical protein K461DRAFT_257495 [Myriangium duriaei CBS 260.36]
MALAPKFAGQKLAAGLSPKAIHTLELYLDYVCPFSKKQFDTVYDSVKPLIEKKYKSKVEIIFRQQIQPWHPSSTLVHEAGVAVLQTNPDKFWEFSKALFDKQKEYFDVNVVSETRNATYKRLAKVAASVGVDESQVYKKLEISDKPADDGSLNTGNAVTNDLKLLIKAARLVGIHVSPTVVFDGIVENSISSSFTVDQWDEWLQKNVA